MRFGYIFPEAFPEPPGDRHGYPARLDLALREWYRKFRRAIRELDAPPIVVASSSGQPLTAGVLAQLQFTADVDTQSWWSGTQCRPTLAGFYRVSWTVNFRDTVAIALGVHAYSGLNGYTSVGYGDGAALDIITGDSTIVECNGTTDVIAISGYMHAGTSPSVYSGPKRSWLTIEYLGGRPALSEL